MILVRREQAKLSETHSKLDLNGHDPSKIYNFASIFAATLLTFEGHTID